MDKLAPAAAKVSVVVFVTAAIFATPSNAALTYWVHDPATAGDWHESANWSDGVPTASVTAQMYNGAVTEILADAAAAEVWLGSSYFGHIAQYAGTTVTGRLFVAHYGMGPVPASTYTLQGNSRLETAQTYMATNPDWNFCKYLSAQFVQTGGTHVTGDLSLSGNGFSQSSYQISGGTLDTQNIYLCPDTHGFAYTVETASEFVQDQGSVSASALLHLATSNDSTVRYELNAGDLTTGETRIGGEAIEYSDAQAVFVQNGGVHQTSRLGLDGRHKTDCIYELHDGTLTADTTSIGPRGIFTQSGGQFAAGSMRVQMWGTMGSVARFQLDGGEFAADSITLGNEGGAYVQNSGTAVIGSIRAAAGGAVCLKGGTSTFAEIDVGSGYSGSDSTLQILSPSAHVTVTELLRFREYGLAETVAGSALHLSGASFEDGRQGNRALWGLKNLTLVFEGGSGSLDLEVSAPNDLAQIGSFLLAGIVVGEGSVCVVQCVDQIDNGHGGTTDALTSGSLQIQEGSRLDVNGLPLYVSGDVEAVLDGYIGASNAGRLFDSTLYGPLRLDAVYLSDVGWTTLEVIPEPASAGLLLAGLAVMTLRRDRR